MDGGAPPDEPRLVTPAIDCHASFLAALAEFQADGQHLELDPSRLAEAAEFAQYVAALRAGARRQGHATAMLAVALPRAAALGIDPARLDCEADNVASRRVIEKNGGVFARQEGDTLFFVLPTR
jgi:RimJ/RimL family protein N-acetyltransferase